MLLSWERHLVRSLKTQPADGNSADLKSVGVCPIPGPAGPGSVWRDGGPLVVMISASVPPFL